MLSIVAFSLSCLTALATCIIFRRYSLWLVARALADIIVSGYLIVTWFYGNLTSPSAILCQFAHISIELLHEWSFGMAILALSSLCFGRRIAKAPLILAIMIVVVATPWIIEIAFVKDSRVTLRAGKCRYFWPSENNLIVETYCFVVMPILFYIIPLAITPFFKKAHEGKIDTPPGKVAWTIVCVLCAIERAHLLYLNAQVIFSEEVDRYIVDRVLQSQLFFFAARNLPLVVDYFLIKTIKFFNKERLN